MGEERERRGREREKGNSAVIHNVKLGKLRRKKKIQDLMECASIES